MPTIIQVVAATGQSVYVFLYNALGQIWNGSAFEAYNVAHWATYAVTATEQAGSGSYIANIPSGLTPNANYSWIGYIKLGGSPASGDTPVSQGPFYLPPVNPSFSVPTSLDDLILTLRILAQDYPDSKTVWQETLGSADQPSFPVDGINTKFRLKKAPLPDAIGMPTYIFVSIVGTGPVVRTQAGFTVVDPVNGIINFTVAPNPGGSSPNGVYVDYNYQWFTDVKYAQFIYQAAQMVLAGTTDPTTVPSGLSDVMLQYALAQFWFARASQYAEQYKSSGGEAMQEVQSVSQTYTALAKAANNRGDILKADYYKSQGQQNSPAYGNPNTYPPQRFDPISPRH